MILAASGSGTDILAGATVGLAAVTAVVAGVGIYQAVITRQALAAAAEEATEAARSRIDQRAPLITIVAEASAGPTSGWGEPLQAGTTFYLPGQASVTLAVNGWFLLRNEGNSTGILDLPEGIVAFDPDRQSVASLNAIKDYAPARNRGQFVLQPGGSRRLMVEIRRPLAEWARLTETAEERRNSITVRAVDTFADGVEDTTELRINGVPVIPGSGQGEWVASTTVSSLYVERTVRTYPGIKESSQATRNRHRQRRRLT